MRPIKRANLNLFEHEGDEVIIGEAYRHKVGIVFIFVSAGIMILLLTALVAIVGKNQSSFTDSLQLEQASITGVLAVFLLVAALIIVAGAFMASYIYKQNYLVLTDQKLVLVHTLNIVRRKISQLSIGDIQDISVEQKTLGSRVFRYGTIVIETAGEQANLRMTLIAKPFDVNRAIVQSHEANMKKYGN